MDLPEEAFPKKVSMICIIVEMKLNKFYKTLTEP